MRLRALAAVCLTVLAGGCGASEKPNPAATDTSEADRRAIAEHVAGYLRAYASGDGERACAALTPELRERSDRLAAERGFDGCAEVLRRVGPKLLAAPGPDERDRLLARISDPSKVVVNLTGDTATAGIEPFRPGRDTSQVGLTRRGDRWLIAELGLPAG
jgi:hypothetical protein